MTYKKEMVNISKSKKKDNLNKISKVINKRSTKANSDYSDNLIKIVDRRDYCYIDADFLNDTFNDDMFNNDTFNNDISYTDDNLNNNEILSDTDSHKSDIESQNQHTNVNCNQNNSHHNESVVFEKEVENLEFILNFIMKENETHELAKHLIYLHETAYNTMNMPRDDLIEDGVGEKVATFLSCIPKFQVYLQNHSTYSKLNMKEDVLRYIGNTIREIHFEEIIMIGLNKQNKVIKKNVLKGITNNVTFDTSVLLKFAFETDSEKLILVHNHPSGNYMPSITDILSTNNVLAALKSIGVELAEHIVVSNKGEFSFFENRIIEAIYAVKYKKKNDFYNIMNTPNYRLELSIKASQHEKLNFTNDEKLILSISKIAMESKNKIYNLCKKSFY